MKRNRDELLYCVLKKCLNDSLKTPLMSYTNQNLNQINSELKFLQKLGWIIEITSVDEKIYKTTERGEKAMEHYESYLDQVPSELLHIFVSERTIKKFYNPTNKKQ
jgi:predicted transcriptional regulator